MGWRERVRVASSPDRLGVFDPGGILSPTVSAWWIGATAAALLAAGSVALLQAGFSGASPVTAVLANLIWVSLSLIVAAETRRCGRAPVPWMLASCLLSPPVVITVLVVLHYSGKRAGK